MKPTNLQMFFFFILQPHECFNFSKKTQPNCKFLQCFWARVIIMKKKLQTLGPISTAGDRRLIHYHKHAETSLFWTPYPAAPTVHQSLKFVISFCLK